MRRRDFLKASALLTTGFPLSSLFAADPAVSTNFKMLGGRQPFDYAWLKEQARTLSARPFHSTADNIPDQLKDLDWDQHQAISYRADHALWGRDSARFQVMFFHLGLFYKMPVRMFEVVDTTHFLQLIIKLHP